MRIFFKPYYYATIILAIVFFIQSLIEESLLTSIDRLSLLIIILAIMSEIMGLTCTKNINISLSAPIIVFALYYKPLIFIYIIIIIYLIASKIFITYKYREYDRVFDMRLFYNIAQYIILSKVSYIFLKWFPINNYLSLVIGTVLLVVIFKILNVIFILTISTFYSNSNRFKNIRYIYRYIYFFAIIDISLIFSYEAYDIWGVIMVGLLIIPMQGNILHSIGYREINTRLIMDKMTNAFNRYFLEELICENIMESREFTLVFLDLDNFKEINDTYGHLAGDAVLIDLVNHIKTYLRKGDRVFRYGGDEFCILFNNREEAEGFKQRLEKKKAENCFEFSGEQIRYAFSVGIVDYNGESDITINDLVNEVDKKMYLDKKKKTNSNNYITT